VSGFTPKVDVVRAARLVQILLILQTRGQVAAPELARELEVSVRTVYRDLEALSAAGVPVYSEPGRYGGARLVDGYRTRLTGLTIDEADAVLLSGLPDAAAELGLGTVLAAAQLKVLAALPPELRGRATRVRERFHLDAPGWFKRTEDLPHLAAVADALWADRRIRVRYARRDPAGAPDGDAAAVERILEPMGLVLKAGVWYLVATPLEADGARTYRVSRILECATLEETFTRPADFDLAGHWTESSEAFERSVQHVEVVALVSPHDARHLRHHFGVSSFEEVDEIVRRAPMRPDGRVEVRFNTERVEIAHHELLGMGAALEVLEPLELRELMQRTAKEMAALYDT
jgi:predicted DNA-binding transcriptional regulator YafY